MQTSVLKPERRLRFSVKYTLTLTLNLRYETSCVKCVTPPLKHIKSEEMDQDEIKKLSGLRSVALCFIAQASTSVFYFTVNFKPLIMGYVQNARSGHFVSLS
jgi:hypothetical protein